MDIFDSAATFNGDYLWFYEATFDDQRNQRETAEALTLLQLDKGASILDAPCGHGRIANLLAAEGFNVTGIDITPLFLDRATTDAKLLGVDVHYRHGDLRALPVAGPFDAVLCWSTSFGYFDDHDNRKVLEQFASVLRPGGTLVLETLHHDGFVRTISDPPTAHTTERDSDSMTDTTTFDSITGRIETTRTVRREGETRVSRHSVRVPTVPELSAWLCDAGFTETRFTDRDGSPLRFDSWRLAAIATR